jgi:pyruvate dehydrogenase E2 component (dihydrolipoamide acetyltransferase)
MATEIKLPELAENVDTVTVSKILVSVGDNIKKDQSILEVETDKAAAEVPSTAAGVVAEIRTSEGDSINVGDVILVLDGEAKKSEDTEDKAEPEEKEAAEEEKKPVEEEAEAKEEAPEDEEPEEEPKAEKEEEEPEEKEPAPAKEKRDEDGRSAPPAAAKTEEQPQRRRSRGGPIPASPSVRRLAREIGIDVHEVSGSGPGGRITEEDVKNHSRQVNSAVRGAAGWQPQADMPLPDFARFGEVERVAMNSVRRRTAQNMAHAWVSIPQVAHFERADITDLEIMRKQYAKRVEAAGGKLTMTAILVKVLAAALQKHPIFNASLDSENSEILLKKYYNIGVAVDSERGLLVPVLKSADSKNITEIAVELNEMAERARNGKSRLDEVQGGSFTISNLGGIGGSNFTPIVYPPEVAIMGVSRARVEPVYVDGQFQPRTIMPFSITYDHRVIDGADAARFARWIAEALEQPFLMFLEG